MKRLILQALTLITVLILLGCSGGGSGTNPMLPDLSENTGQKSTRSADAHRDLWGWWEVTIDPISKSVEIVPIRSAMFRANVTQWMQPPIGNLNNLKIDIVDMSTYMTDGRIVVDVSLTHPFPGLVEYTGFDVNGIFINDLSAVDSLNPDISYPLENIDAGILENPDGFTRWFNYPEFAGSIPILGYTPGYLGNIEEPSATLNPYKYFSDDLGAEDDVVEFFTDELNIENRGMYLHGVTNTRRYNLQFPINGSTPVLKYQYAVSASWEEGDPEIGGNPDIWDAPDDFPISANQQEPFLLNIDSTGSDIYFDDSDSSFGGNLVLDIEVFSWQHLYPVYAGLSKINISTCETCSTLPVTVTIEGAALETAVVPGGGTSVSSVYHVDLTGLMPTANGAAPLLISVEPKNPASYDQGFGTPIPDGALAAYMLHWVDIATESGCTPPTAFAEATSATEISNGDTVDFDASATTGTPPFTWEWDWDGDGVYDEMTSDPLITHQFDDEGVFYVMCNASNDCGEDEIDAPITITVSDCGTGVPQLIAGSGTGSSTTYGHMWIALLATINDPNPKLIAPGHQYTSTMWSKILLHPITDPYDMPATHWHSHSGGDQVGYYRGRLAVDGTTAGIDRIFYVALNTSGYPNFVDWDGVSETFSNETQLANCNGGILRMCTTDEGDLIVVDYYRRVHLYDKSNNYAYQLLFQFENSPSGIPYSLALDSTLGQIGYDPVSELILFPTNNTVISLSGQLYGFDMSGTRQFVDQDVFETPMTGYNLSLIGCTVDMSSPMCRVFVHGGGSGGPMYFARFTDGLTNKNVDIATTNGGGGWWGAITDGRFWTNHNSNSYGRQWYDLPADW